MIHDTGKHGAGTGMVRSSVEVAYWGDGAMMPEGKWRWSPGFPRVEKPS